MNDRNQPNKEQSNEIGSNSEHGIHRYIDELINNNNHDTRTHQVINKKKLITNYICQFCAKHWHFEWGKNARQQDDNLLIEAIWMCEWIARAKIQIEYFHAVEWRLTFWVISHTIEINWFKAKIKLETKLFFLAMTYSHTLLVILWIQLKMVCYDLVQRLDIAVLLFSSVLENNLNLCTGLWFTWLKKKTLCVLIHMKPLYYTVSAFNTPQSQLFCSICRLVSAVRYELPWIFLSAWTIHIFARFFNVFHNVYLLGINCQLTKLSLDLLHTTQFVDLSALRSILTSIVFFCFHQTVFFYKLTTFSLKFPHLHSSTLGFRILPPKCILLQLIVSRIQS